MTTDKLPPAMAAAGLVFHLECAGERFADRAYVLSEITHAIASASESPPPACVAGFDGTNSQPGVAGGGDTGGRRLAALERLAAAALQVTGEAMPVATAIARRSWTVRGATLAHMIALDLKTLSDLAAAIPPKQGRDKTGTPAAADSGDSGQGIGTGVVGLDLATWREHRADADTLHGQDKPK